MSCIQASIRQPRAGASSKSCKSGVERTSHSFCQSSHWLSLGLYVNVRTKSQYNKGFPRLIYGASENKRSVLPHAYGGTANFEGDNEAVQRDSLNKATRNSKYKQSVEDLLREQIQKGEFYPDEGGKIPPRGGGDGSGGSGDGDFASNMNEVLQVILATMGFIFLYICIVRGDELTRLSIDYISYLFGRRSTLRLQRAMHKWRRLSQSLTWKRGEMDNHLE